MSAPAAPREPIRVLVVDDEPAARRRLRALLRADPDVVVAGECGSGTRAVEAIGAEPAPELVLLDIEMPGGGGFEVIDAVGAERMPPVVFVTAYDQYALKAFEVHALDYLLKPFDRERFRAAMERAKEAVRERRARAEPSPDRRLASLLADVRAGTPFGGRLAIRADGRITLLPLAEIDWVEADGNGARVHARGGVHAVRQTLAELERRLPRTTFVRIHRSAIVNADRVRELQPWFQGDYVFVLADGTKLTSGRTYREQLRAMVERML